MPSQSPLRVSSPTPPARLAPVVLGLHHVAIAVSSIDDARSVYETALGMLPTEIEYVEHQGVRVLVLFAGSQRIELVEPAADDSPISKFLDRSGGRGGLHHLAWSVADLGQAIKVLMDAGVEMIDEAPCDGSHGTRVAFVHPRSTCGVLMELVEDPDA